MGNFERKRIYMTIIDIYSGFLGAGKTTLIKKMIKEAYQGEQIVLIENEFGEIGIDGGFMQEAGIQVNEMNSGCICCSLVGDFGKALAQVIADYHPDRILIEPSGVGKLSDVIGAVERVATEEVRLGSYVTVADVTKCKIYLKNFGEFYENQIEAASAILLSRTSGIAEDKLKAAVALLREHNPDALYITTPWDELDGKQIREAIEHRHSLHDELESMMEAAEHAHHEHEHHHHDHDEHCCCHEHDHEHHHHHDHDEHCCCHEHDHEHHHHHDHDEHCCCLEHEHHHHDHDEHCCCHEHDHEHHHHHADEVFTSWGIETPKKFTAEEIRCILIELEQEEVYGMVLRAKGIVPAVDGGWIHFDFVPGEMDIRSGGAAVTGRLCVIGSKLNEQAIAGRFGV